MNRQRGFSLVELMVSMAVLLLALAGLAKMTIESSQINRAQQMTAQVQANARNCMTMVVQKLRSAGWDPATEGEPGTTQLLHTARTAIHRATGLTPHLRHDRITAAELQIRLGQDYQWYPYRRIRSRWEPAGGPNPDPAAALAPLLHP